MLEKVEKAGHQRHARNARFQRLAALHGGVLGVALLGLAELAAPFEQALARCPGHESLPCAARGGRPRECFVRKLEQLAHSSLRGGRSRRLWERRFLEEEVGACLEAFAGYFPAELRPVLEYTREQVAADMEYLNGVVG